MRTLVADIVRETAAKHGLSVNCLLDQCPQRAYAWPRQEAMYRVINECLHVSYTEAGRRLGGRDHTTVLHGVRAYCRRNGLDYRDIQKKRRWQKSPDTFSTIAERYAEAMKQGGQYAPAP
jgi:hypothetical protein